MPEGTPTTLRIATRKSALALWQTEHVADMLRSAHPGLDVVLVPMSTRGDEVLDRSLAAVGGKGLFLKELELAMQDGRADCAVHSLKDVPMDLDGPFVLPAILERANPFDAFVCTKFSCFADLPHAARVGTSSLRRHAQLRAARPDLQISDLRGNVNTRLAKLDSGQYDAIVLACAGLERLGMDTRIASRLATNGWLPAVAQGAIAVECVDSEVELQALLGVLDHADTRCRVTAERAMNRRLHGSCQVPIAGFCERVGDRLHLRGLVGDAKTGELVRAEASGPADDPETLGVQVANALLEQGAGALLAKLDAPEASGY
jgi:hydroxymethylbilane synthase